MSQISPKKVKLNKGVELVIRTPEKADAEKLIGFVKQVSIESKYLLLEKDEFSMTVEQEVEWIESSFEDEGALILIGEIEGEVVSITNARNGSRKRNAHVAHLGTSVSQKWRGHGIGKVMMKELCQWAKENQLIEFLQLSVMSGNEVARGLYEGLGFKALGEVPNAYKYEDGNYQGDVIMSLEV